MLEKLNQLWHRTTLFFKRLHRSAVALVVRHPQFESLRKVILVVAGSGVAASVIFEENIQKATKSDFQWEFYAVVACIILVALAELFPLIVRVPTVPVSSFSSVMKELRVAVMLRPFGDTGSYTLKDRENDFSMLACLIERQVDGLLQFSNAEGVSCNLLVVLPDQFDTSDFSKLKAKLQLNDSEILAPFSQDQEGIFDDKHLDALLLMCGRGDRAKVRGYPWVALRVPKKHQRCLPGAPEIFHDLKRTKTKSPSNRSWSRPYRYLPDPSDKRRISFGSEVNDAMKNAFTSYFVSHAADIGSFLSIGIEWDGLPVAVLNIDSRQGDFLVDPVNRDLVLDLVSPFAEIAASFAHVFRSNLKSW